MGRMRPAGATDDFTAHMDAIRDRAGAAAKLGPARPGHGEAADAAIASAADVPYLLHLVDELLPHEA